jgi:cytochrome c-type biogenesis protein CcmH/NrfG
MDRLAMLRQMVTAKPDDPFPKYGLAMELRKRGDHQEACSAFEQLVDAHPDYVASYLMFGGLLVEIGDKARAAEIYARGFEIATRVGNAHAAGELDAARNAL